MSLTLAPASLVKVTVTSGTLRSSRHVMARPMARGDLVTQPGIVGWPRFPTSADVGLSKFTRHCFAPSQMHLHLYLVV